MLWLIFLLEGSFLPVDVIAQCSNGDLRISEGTAEHGYLDYCWNNQFGIVCGTFFDDHNAQVACRQLGLQAEGATGVGEYQKRSANATMYLFYMECEGNESTVSECPILDGPQVECEDGHGDTFVVARINCGGPGATSAPPCNNGDLRISEGDFRNGYLEYCWNNEFGVVCGETFDNADAQVACRQLGYQSDGAVGRGDYQPRPDSAMMYLYTINCEGSENEILDCDIPGGPENGLLYYRNKKSYCSWKAEPGIFYDYLVAKIKCGASMSSASSPTVESVVETKLGRSSVVLGASLGTIGGTAICGTLVTLFIIICYMVHRKKTTAGSNPQDSNVIIPQEPVYCTVLQVDQNISYAATKNERLAAPSPCIDPVELMNNPAYSKNYATSL